MLGKKLQADQLEALKANNPKKLTTLRYIIAQIKNKEIEKKSELSDEEVVTILQKIKKELQETIDAAQKGGRDDLIAENKEQFEIVASYLPEELSDEKIEGEIDRLIEENKEAMEKNPKAIIGIVMKELRGKADPSRIMPILQKKTS